MGLLPVLKGRGRDRRPLPSLRIYLVQCFAIQISLAVLMTADVVLVKHYLPDNTDFAYAATLGRMVAFMAAAVSAAMFPKVASNQTFTREHRALYFRSLGYASFFIVVSLMICLSWPAIFHRFLFNIVEPSADLLALTRLMALVMIPATLLNINAGLLLAQRRFGLLSVVVVCAILFFSLVHLFHGSAYNVVYFEGAGNLICLVVTTWGILRIRKEKIPEVV